LAAPAAVIAHAPTLDGEQVVVPPGGFYGDWVTSCVVGLCKESRGRVIECRYEHQAHARVVPISSHPPNDPYDASGTG
jgi:hypothetical protein